jgi:small-conductance mechanosensitive channel
MTVPPAPGVPAELWRFVAVLRGTGIFLAVFVTIYAPGRFLVVPVAKRTLDSLAVDQTFELPFLKVLHAAIAIFAAFLAATTSGFASFLVAAEALAAALTIALGFASQDVLGNLVSGVFIVLDPQFKIGDWIEWDDKEGVIEDISFRVTRVHTFDNELISVPNSELTANAVTNPVAKDRLRVSMDFGIGYEDDIDRAREIMIEAARSHPEILDRPGATVRLEEFAPSYVDVRVRFWIGNPARTDFVRIRSEYAQTVKERFDAAGVEMPYPYRQLTGTVGTHEVTEFPEVERRRSDRT